MLVNGLCAADVNKTSGVPYKFGNGGAAYETHYNIDRDATLAGIENFYFKSQGQATPVPDTLFRYPSEICDIFLVPSRIAGGNYSKNAQPPSTSGSPLARYQATLAWYNPYLSGANPASVMSMTGDNLREEPYDHIYPRLTTKSNTYTVHYRVQTLVQLPKTRPKTTGATAPVAWDQWVEGQDQVLSESRGSSMIERFVDPNDPALNGGWDNDTLNLNLAGNNHADLSSLYRFRVISTKKFAP
jgi:hypothetical protein